MDLHRLEVFCKVVDLKSFTRAAEAMFLSQPTVSEHVRTLEESLGEKLLDRLGREVLPTPAGSILYRHARGMLRLREEALEALAVFKGRLTGRLAVGASTIPGTYLLPPIIGVFKTLHPSIRVVLDISSTAPVAESVLQGRTEVGVVGSVWKDRRLRFEEIFSDELVLAVYGGHPWEDRRSAGLEELYGEPFIQRQRGSGTRMVMSRILEGRGFDFSRLNVVAEMSTTEAVRQSIKARIGISVLSRQAVAEDCRRGVLREVAIEGVRFQRPFYLVVRKNRELSPVGAAFVEYVRGEDRRRALEAAS